MIVRPSALCRKLPFSCAAFFSHRSRVHSCGRAHPTACVHVGTHTQAHVVYFQLLSFFFFDGWERTGSRMMGDQACWCLAHFR